ncbi:hypothetical protein K435DRAFT_694965, partial [Dendrothele bispora CBS 962.96]
GVRRYLDGKDASSTSNLRKHAVSCFGQSAVDAATQGLKEAMSTQNTIYSMFAGVGNRIVSITHRMHTNPERRCRPIKIVEDRKLREIVLAGRPQAQFSHRRELAQDIDTAFTVCSERIAKILKEYPGQLSFATDCWTSPNHRAFCAWTVHLQHQGKPLVFLLDVIEVPEVRLYSLKYIFM